MRRRVLICATLAGLLLAALLVVQQGLAGVGDALVQAGWWILVIVLIHGVQVALSGAAWQSLLITHTDISTSTFTRLRMIREAVGNLLPMTQIGGEFIGARLLSLRGLGGGLAGASVVVDLSVETLAQLVFTLLGLTILVISGQSAEATYWAVAGAIVMGPALVGFLLAQHYGLFRILERLCGAIAARSKLFQADATTGLHDEIQKLYNNPGRLLRAINLHLLSWLTGTFEVWVILWSVGAPVSLAQALIIESLGQAIRSAAFIIPGGYGVQEGGYILIGTWLGLPPGIGLVVSVLKRVREIILGLPGLLDWQILEGKRLWPAKTLPLRPDSDD